MQDSKNAFKYGIGQKIVTYEIFQRQLGEIYIIKFDL